ncbi:MAG: macro domain-containing protein [Candidatus Omnitrophica bacterium]|nr:macro domain-containing protein [Candidatus Omnitrophota bacterium]
MTRSSISIRLVSIVLAATFITGQVSAGQISSNSSNNTLAAPVVSGDIDPARSADVKKAVAGTAKPGAIGNGIPLLKLAEGALPPRIVFPAPDGMVERTAIEKIIYKRIQLAIDRCVEDKAQVRDIHRKRFEGALDNLIDLRNRLSQRLYLYNADIMGPEDYLLGFNFQEYCGLSLDFMEWVEEKHFPDVGLAARLIAQYIFHECVPEKGIITERDDHRAVYNEIQSDIFGKDEVFALKKDLREFINEKVSEMPAIGAGQALNKISAGQIRIGSATIGILQGDITQVPAEAVVPGINNIMNVGIGVTGAISRVIGYENEGEVFPSPEAVTGKSAFRVGDVYAAPLGNIQTAAGWKYVISAIIHSGRPWSYPTEESIRASTKNALIEASKRKVQSITFPALGAGALRMDFNTSARSMYAGIREFLAENPETSLRDIKIVLSDAPAVAPFRQELMKLAESAKNISPEQAEIKLKSASLKNKTIEIVKVMARDGKADVRPIIELARQIYPNFDSHISESQWPSVTPKMFTILNLALKYQVYLPNNEIFEIARISEMPDVVRGRIKGGLWREQGYLKSKSKIWIAESSPTEEGYSSLGLEAGWFAIVNVDCFREAGKEWYRQHFKQSTLSSGGSYTSPYEMVMIPLVQTARIEEDDFVEGIYVEHARQEAIRRAQDKAYAAQRLGRDNRFDLDKDGQTVSKILKPDSLLKERALNHLDQQVAGSKAAAELDWQVSLRTVIEYSAMLGGAIAEMKKHIADGQEELAYLAFLNFMEYQFLYANPKQMPGDSIFRLTRLKAALLFFRDIDEWSGKELKHDSMDILNELGTKYGKMPAAEKSLIMLEEIYAKHFWTDDERYDRLSSEPFELPGPFPVNYSETTSTVSYNDVKEKGDFEIDFDAMERKLFPVLSEERAGEIGAMLQQRLLLKTMLSHLRTEDEKIAGGQMQSSKIFDIYRKQYNLSKRGYLDALRLYSDLLAGKSAASHQGVEDESKQRLDASKAALAQAIARIVLFNGALSRPRYWYVKKQNEIIIEKDEDSVLYVTNNSSIYYILRAANLQKGDVILDAFSGSGGILSFLSLEMAPKTIIAADIKYGTPEEGEKTYAINKNLEGVKHLFDFLPQTLRPILRDITILKQDSAYMALPDSSVDKIIADPPFGRNEKDDKYPDEIRAFLLFLRNLKEFHRVLKSGGAVFCHMPMTWKESLEDFEKIDLSRASPESLYSQFYTRLEKYYKARGCQLPSYEYKSEDWNMVKDILQKIIFDKKIFELQAVDMEQGALTVIKLLKPQKVNPAVLSAKEGIDEKHIEAADSFVRISEDLPVRAKEFEFNLTKILADHPDQLFFIGIENDIGESQKAQIMPIYHAIDEIRDMKDASEKPLFPNLMVKRSSAKDLTAMVNDLNKEGKLKLNNAFICAKKASVENKLYYLIEGEGRAWISAIDDLLREGDYLPVFEAITLNMMAYLNADLTAIKNFYDAISGESKSPGELQDMIKNRIIYILPKATKLDAGQLRKLYELAKKAYTSA